MSGSKSPTDSHCPVSVDDTALLLPSTSTSSSSLAAVAATSAAAAAAAGAGNGDGGDVHVNAVAREVNAQAKSSLVDASCEVYTITDDSLPSHMRSLLPNHEKQVHDLLSLERTRQRLRYVILGLTLMLALTVVVAVALVLNLKVRPLGGVMDKGHFRSPSFPVPGDQGTEVATEVKVSLLDDDSSHPQNDPRTRYRHVGPKGRRTPCVTECWSYAAFRFRSDCQDGFCRCYGEDYDTYTCLPKFNNCNIEKKFPSHSSVKLFGKNQTTYVCHVPPRDQAENVHVISIFGNHRAPTTHVTVKNQSAAKNVLVLVNYHFVQWTMHLPEDSGVSKIFIVSMKRNNQAKQVIFLGPATNLDVEVTHKLSLTGYGEDKNGGHTPKLLRFIEEEVGPVTSFLGASHADEIVVDMTDLPTTTTTTTTTTPTMETTVNTSKDLSTSLE